MHKSPIQFEDYKILKFEIQPTRDFKESGQYDGRFKVFKKIRKNISFWDDNGYSDVPEDIKAKTYDVLFGLTSKSEESAESPYEYEVLLAGHFYISNSFGDLEKDEKLIFQYGLSILYGKARDLIHDISYKMPNGVMMLPTLSFMDEEPEFIKLKND